MKYISFLFVLIFLSSSLFAQIEVYSPNKHVICHIDEETTTYTVFYKGDSILTNGRFGFVLGENDSLTHFSIEKHKITTVNETWEMVWGPQSTVQNKYSECVLEMIDQNSGLLLNVFLRCYDDGFAFRYYMPDQNGPEEIIIESEESRFTLCGEYESWWIWADYNTYEKTYIHSGLDSTHHVAAPFTLRKENGTHICIHEAALVDYSSMTLLQDGENDHCFKVNLVPAADGMKVRTQTPFESPWRVFFLADNAADLANSMLLYNLNEPCKIENTDWIKPVNYIGIWWEMHLGISDWAMTDRHGATTENMKRYIDFAAAHGIDAVLAEGWNKGWENWGEKDAFSFTEAYPDFKLKELAEYADEKGVYIIGHHETGGDTESYERQLDSAFALYQSLGIHHVKTGYAGPSPKGEHKHGQYMVNHYNLVMEKAAEYEISLDVHEPVMFSGLCRTYPNMMCGEGVRGMEWNAWSEGNMPSHTCIMPFTRGMAGPIDYTPGIFDIDLSYHKDERVKWNSLDQGNTAVHSTLANQVALMVVLYSPMQMAADLIENYEGHEAFSFIENLPATWDESVYLDAEIGEFIIVARRSGSTWYVAAITNEKKRWISIQTDFLEEGKTYNCRMLMDKPLSHYDDNPEDYMILDMDAEKGDNIELKLAPGGGALLILEEK
jgi:alpha-glucosidase